MSSLALILLAACAGLFITGSAHVYHRAYGLYGYHHPRRVLLLAVFVLGCQLALPPVIVSGLPLALLVVAVVAVGLGLTAVGGRELCLAQLCLVVGFMVALGHHGAAWRQLGPVIAALLLGGGGYLALARLALPQVAQAPRG